MKLKEIYDLAIKLGIENDPRGKEEIDRILAKNREDFDGLRDKEKPFYDTEKLSNPYGDTRILNGDPELEITALLTGIDLELPEALLADRLNERGANINLLLAHHPEGEALAGLSEVMGMQADIWQNAGVPINIGDVLIDTRMKEVARTIMPVNHNRAIDGARLLGLAFMNVHTPADNMVTRFVQRFLDGKKLSLVKDVVDALKEIPEYEQAAKQKMGPTLLVGSPSTRAGKIMVDMTGGTEGPEEAIAKLADAGVGTIVGMHLGDKLRKRAEESRLNVVIAGHIASDAIGLNLVLDQIEAKGVEIVACSGLTRVKRS